jgi:hypothetical protein
MRKKTPSWWRQAIATTLIATITTSGCTGINGRSGDETVRVAEVGDIGDGSEQPDAAVTPPPTETDWDSFESSFVAFDGDFKDTYCTLIAFMEPSDSDLDNAGCGSGSYFLSGHSQEAYQITNVEIPEGYGDDNDGIPGELIDLEPANPPPDEPPTTEPPEGDDDPADGSPDQVGEAPSGDGMLARDHVDQLGPTAGTPPRVIYAWGIFGRAAVLGTQLFRALGRFAVALRGPGSGPLRTLMGEWRTAFNAWVTRVTPSIGQARRLLRAAGNHGIVKTMRGGLAWTIRATGAGPRARRAMIWVGSGLLLVGTAYGLYKIWSYYRQAEETADSFTFARQCRTAAEQAETRLQAELRDVPQSTREVYEAARGVISYVTLLVQLEGIATTFSSHLLTQRQRTDVAEFITQLRLDAQTLIAIRLAIVGGNAPTQTQIDGATAVVRRYEAWAANRPGYIRARTNDLVRQFEAGQTSTGQVMINRLTLIRGRNIAPDVMRLNGIMARVRAAVEGIDDLAFDLELVSNYVVGVADRMETNPETELASARTWDEREIEFMTTGDHAVTETVPSDDELGGSFARSRALREDLQRVDDHIRDLIAE